MRQKENIVTHVFAPDRTFESLGPVISHAEIWSNEVRVTCRSGGTVGVDRSSRRRASANLLVFRGSQTSTCVALEPDWLISDPHIVRDAIELNSGATLFARRLMMISEDEYRIDGIYIPIPVAVVYRMRAVGRYSSELNVAPDYAWTNQLRAEAPFEILDYQFKGADTSGATIRSYEGMIPILKEHA